MIIFITLLYFAYIIVMVIVGILGIAETIKFRNKGILTTADVLKIQHEGEESDYLMASISFKTNGGQTIKRTFRTTHYRFNKDTIVKILYLPHSPNTYLMNDSKAYKHLFKAFFMLFSGLGLLYFYFRLLNMKD